MSSFFFFFKYCITCLDSFRHHKRGKLISNAFLRGRVGEGRNLAQIIMLRETSQKAYSREGQKRVWICWLQSGLWIETQGSKSADGVRVWARERKLGLGSRTRNFLSKGKWMKKLPTNPLITLLHGLKSYTAQCLVWCPLTGEGKQNVSLDAWSMLVLNIWSIKKSASFIHFWHSYCIITLPCVVTGWVSGQSYFNGFYNSVNWHSLLRPIKVSVTSQLAFKSTEIHLFLKRTGVATTFHHSLSK